MSQWREYREESRDRPSSVSARAVESILFVTTFWCLPEEMVRWGWLGDDVGDAVMCCL